MSLLAGTLSHSLSKRTKYLRVLAQPLLLLLPLPYLGSPPPGKSMIWLLLLLPSLTNRSPHFCFAFLYQIQHSSFSNWHIPQRMLPSTSIKIVYFLTISHVIYSSWLHSSLLSSIDNLRLFLLLLYIYMYGPAPLVLTTVSKRPSSNSYITKCSHIYDLPLFFVVVWVIIIFIFPTFLYLCISSPKREKH